VNCLIILLFLVITFEPETSASHPKCPKSLILA